MIIVYSLGSLGVVVGRFQDAKTPYFDKDGNMITELGTFQLRYYQSEPIKTIVNVSGAGDSFSSGFIAGMLRGLPENVCISVGFEAANKALHSKNAVAESYFDDKHHCWRTPSPFQSLKLFWGVTLFFNILSSPKKFYISWWSQSEKFTMLKFVKDFL